MIWSQLGNQPQRGASEIPAVFSIAYTAMKTLRQLGCPCAPHRLAVLATAVAALSLGSACHAQDAERTFDLHGYGQVSEVRNESAPGGGFRFDYDLSVLGVWRMRPDIRAWVQLARHRDSSTRLEWAFLDWDVSSANTVRLGQARVPMGLVNEARDVQTLRNSISIPMLYDEEHGLVDEALRGVIVEHRRESSKTGGLVAEAYAAGSMVSDETSNGVSARIVGGRLQWTPPSSDWTFAASAYGGRQASSEPDAAPGRHARHALVMSAKLHAMNWDFSGEIGAGRHGEGEVRVGYLQADRGIAPQSAFFVRAESAHRRSLDDDGSQWRSRLAMGLAWKPSPHWGLRVEAGTNRASPMASSSPAAPPRTQWNDVAVSFNFYL